MVIFRCAGLSDSTNDGLGEIALDTFFQGCSMKCSGCHNPELQDFKGGFDYNTDDIIKQIKKYNDFYKAIVFVGGEPLEQPEALYDLASKSGIKNILYTGWLYDDIPDKIKSVMNIIVDGPYIESLRTDGFPASSNQKIYCL
jgi:anaerobic ribonucleoside-triphosphate reductase activating protein